MLHRPLLLAACLTLATSASAAWAPGGQLVSNPGDVNGVRNARIMELPSGDLLVLGVGVSGNNNDYVLQRLTHNGSFATGWPASGVSFSSVLKGTTLRWQSFVVDDAARTWHTFNGQSGSLLDCIGEDAVRLPAPIPMPPYNIGSNTLAVRAAPAPGGEVFVTAASTPRLKRITSAGVAAAGWTTNGIALPGASYFDNALLPDGSGGVVVFLRESASAGVPIALRFDGNAALHAGWAAGGLTLSSVSPLNDLGPMDSQLLPSGPAHALAVWSLDAGSGTRRLMMQRFGLDGTLDPAWPVDGLEVVAPDTISACRAIADGAGGAYVVRQAQGVPVATHVTSAGTLLGSANTPVLDAGAQYMPTRFGPGTPTTMNVVPDDMIADVTTDGNLLVGWSDTRLAPQVTFRLRWLTPALAPAPDKPADGLVFAPASPHPFAGAMLAVKADGPAGAFIAWADYHDTGFGQTSGDVWMTYVSAPTTTGVTPSVPELHLSAPRPNPAFGTVALDLVLPDDSPARVELLDVAGRVLRTQVVQGAGRHAVTFDALASLPPGLYFVRAKVAGTAETRRVALSR